MFEVKEHENHFALEVSGKEYKFFVLTPYDRFEIIKRIKLDRKRAIIENAQLLGFSNEQIFGSLEQFEDEWQEKSVGANSEESQFIRWFNSSASFHVIAEMALKENAADAKAIVAGMKLNSVEQVYFKASLTGTPLGPVQQQEAGETNDRPLVFGTSGGNSIGTSTDTGSNIGSPA